MSHSILSRKSPARYKALISLEQRDREFQDVSIKQSRFPDQVADLSSKISLNERYYLKALKETAPLGKISVHNLSFFMSKLLYWTKFYWLFSSGLPSPRIGERITHILPWPIDLRARFSTHNTRLQHFPERTTYRLCQRYFSPHRRSERPLSYQSTLTFLFSSSFL